MYTHRERERDTLDTVVHTHTHTHTHEYIPLMERIKVKELALDVRLIQGVYNHQGVTDALKVCLDDPKRAVRVGAVETRNAWFLVKE